MGKEYLLQVQNVTKRYRDKLALNDFSMDIRSGEIVALIGENGAGKTTLLNIICGYIKPSVGLVQYKGENIFEKPLTIQEGHYICGFSVQKNNLKSLFGMEG